MPARQDVPAVIVIQEWWGLVGHITSVADRLAAAGFLALAPDLYHGTGHAFFNDDRPEVHNEAAAALSWDRTLTFLNARLGAA